MFKWRRERIGILAMHMKFRFIRGAKFQLLVSKEKEIQ